MPGFGEILEKISQAIGGTVVFENDTFYLLQFDGRKVEFSLEAEGLRKLGLLWKLIRNGLLEPGSILLWDEPEANLNPELFPLTAEILLALSRNGVQIFLATHSFNFSSYLEILRTDTEQVRLHNLIKSGSGEIRGISAHHMDQLGRNALMDADEKLLDAVYDMG